eukprot:Nitzschia sp. Nitz4//scaffold131_size63436//29849//34134//NITZ4_006274-RA/size63436-processed-gene-0.102-mRNA-1//1//CDS//3329535265//6570//frame0
MNIGKTISFILLFHFTSGEVDPDYVDYTFGCPLVASCPRICVATPFDCPQELQCEGNMTLCADGSCAQSCDETLTSPCTSECAPIACPLVKDYYEECLERYSDYYEYEASCQVSDDPSSPVSPGSRYSWTDPIYIVGYLWISGVTFAIIGWCWFNHWLVPIADATKRLDTGTHSGQGSMTQQTGYKRHPVGQMIYYWTLATYIVWATLLSAIVIPYYKHGDNEADSVMLLRTFCLVWNVGILWCLMLQWPHSNETLFLRKCALHEATHVAVHHRLRNEVAGASMKEPIKHPVVGVLGLLLDIVGEATRKLMVMIFADPNVRPRADEGLLKYCPVQRNSSDGSRFFVFLFRRYNFHEKRQVFVAGTWQVGTTFKEMAPPGMSKVHGFDTLYENAVHLGDNEEDTPSHVFDKPNCMHAEGLNNEEVATRQKAVGRNVIVMPSPSYFREFRQELVKPFYIYQFFILWIWIALDYWYMSVIAWGIIFCTACTVSYFRYRGSSVLHAISHVTGTVTVLRNDTAVTIPQTEVVPGDVVGLATGVCQCDLVLLDGKVLVDESALTGEATPQAKASIDPTSDVAYDPHNHKRQTILAGTKVLECDDALALVIKTGSFTKRGEMLREIIAFRHHVPQYETELPTAVGFLVLWSVVAFVYTQFYSSDSRIVAWALGMATFSNAFPALLPISFTFPVGISFDRLAKQGVACANSDAILLSGRVSRAFFDKTGTLTKQGLEYINCRSASSWNVGLWTSEELSTAMAVCHSLIMSKEGAILGNPVDRAMFAAAGAKMQKVTDSSFSITDGRGRQITVLRRFDFDHNTMTQSVVVRMHDGSLRAYVKGSGENIVKRCTQESLPSTFQQKLRVSSRQGMYLIAVAAKELPADTKLAEISRVDIESDLTFAGVLNFSNKIREETPAVIRELTNAHIQSIMLTGDSVYTGIHIARKAGLILRKDNVILGVLNDIGTIQWINEKDEVLATPTLAELSDRTGGLALAMSGAAWSHLLAHDREQALALVPYVRVFARCSPHDKVSVVDTFASLGATTFMCGDGGNDAGALKAAHVGLALSDSEASIVAPFTSLDKDITAVLTLLKEGRAALASTMSTFKYIILYGQVSSYNQLILYTMGVSLSDWMWFFIDGVWTVLFSLTLPLALPAEKLSKNRPTGSILGRDTVASVVGILILHYAFMATALVVLFNEDWFQCRKYEISTFLAKEVFSISDNYEAQVIFLVSSVQILATAMVYNIGYEFRRTWFRNWGFVLVSLCSTALLIYVTLVPSHVSCLFRTNCSNDNIVRGILDAEPSKINNYFHTTIMPESFRVKILCILLGNALAVAAYDYFVVNGLRRRTAQREQESDPTRPFSVFKDADETSETKSSNSINAMEQGENSAR